MEAVGSPGPGLIIPLCGCHWCTLNPGRRCARADYHPALSAAPFEPKTPPILSIRREIRGILRSDLPVPPSRPKVGTGGRFGGPFTPSAPHHFGRLPPPP